MTEIKPLGEFRQKHRKCFLKIWQRIHFWYCLLEMIFFTSAWWLAGHPCRGFHGHQKKCLDPGYWVQIFPTALLHITFVVFYGSFSKQRCTSKRVLVPGTCCTLGCFQLMKQKRWSLRGCQQGLLGLVASGWGRGGDMGEAWVSKKGEETLRQRASADQASRQGSRWLRSAPMGGRRSSETWRRTRGLLSRLHWTLRRGTLMNNHFYWDLSEAIFIPRTDR